MCQTEMKDELRLLPSVDKLLSEEKVRQLQKEYPNMSIVNSIREQLQSVRLSITAGNRCPTIGEIIDSICARVHSLVHLSLRPVINGTGVVIHTNLGRAPLSKETMHAMDMAADGYCNLEFDLDSGKRGSRGTHIEQILCELSGAEAAVVVNNNASAVLLAITALARRKEVIVSRGQAVEIGGGFRIPDIMRQSGAKLLEVGTTNSTYVTDYEEAINSRTSALLRVHSSNFKIVGFIHSVNLDELVMIGNRHDLPVFDDLGSGCLLDTTAFKLAPEPMMQQSIVAGASLVFSSGDKLLGGPQAGIIVGQRQFIEKLRKHPLARAMRIDKVRLAGLITTLTHYIKGEATDKIPIWRMISAPLDGIEQRAQSWAHPFKSLAEVIDGETMIGGGSLPEGALPTKLVAIRDNDKKTNRNIALEISKKLRQQDVPVLGRLNGNTFLLDPRTVLSEQDDIVLQAIKRAISF